MLDLSSSTLGHLLAVANSGEHHQTVPGKSLCYHYNHEKKVFQTISIIWWPKKIKQIVIEISNLNKNTSSYARHQKLSVKLHFEIESFSAK